ncbi:hypothetical protein V5799_014001, partial [Amblyomma americanum]
RTHKSHAFPPTDCRLLSRERRSFTSRALEEWSRHDSTGRSDVRGAQINDTKSCTDSDSSRNQFCRNDLDANLMLQIFALDEQDEFCLSQVWTNRDLGEGTLGLAYLGYPSARRDE